jgi:hypothetical protein
MRTLLNVNGRCAIVVPNNVLLSIWLEFKVWA